MKKSKLFISLLSVGSITTVITPMLAMTSCNKNNPTVTSISAKYKLGTTVYEGVAIKRSDIEVTATKTDGSSAIVTNWTSTSFVDDTYVVTSKDIEQTQVLLPITYANKNTVLVIGTASLAQCKFLFPEITIWKGNNISSQKEVIMYALGGLSPQLLSAGYFKFVYYEDDVQKDKGITVKRLGSKDIYLICVDENISGTKHTIKAFRQTDTALENPLDEMNVVITNDDISATMNDDYSANVVIKKGLGDQGSGLVNVPEYIHFNGATHLVSSISTDEKPTNVNKIIIPKTVTSISDCNFDPDEKHAGWAPLTNIYFTGKSDEWNNIIADTDWQGKFVMGAYCYDDGKFVNFSNCYTTVFHSKCTEREDKPTLVAESKIGGAITHNYRILFDYSLIKSGTPSTYTKLNITNSAIIPIGSLGINGVYINGVELTNDTHYKITDDEGRFGKSIELLPSAFPSGTTLDKNSLVLLEIKAPNFSKDSLWIGAFDPNN